jgi:serine/threonine protein kinase
VVQVLGFFEDDSHAYIVMVRRPAPLPAAVATRAMRPDCISLHDKDQHFDGLQEHCGGGDVYQRVVLEQRSDEGFAAAGVVAPLLRAVHRLHTRHAIVHRDIKPENVLLTAGGQVSQLGLPTLRLLPRQCHACGCPPTLPARPLQVRLADFGTAIKQDVEVPFLPVGTLDFMAPEVLGARVPKGAVESPCTTPDMLREHGMAPHDEKASEGLHAVRPRLQALAAPPHAFESGQMCGVPC